MRILSVQKAAPLTLAAIVTFAMSIPAAAQGNGMRSNGSSIALHGVPPSVTSFGFGGRPGFHGVPPSVTSFGFGGRPGFHGVAPSLTSQNFGRFPLRTDHGIHQGQFFSPRRHRGHRFVSPFYGNVVAVPYAYPLYMTDSGMDGDDSMNDAAIEEDDDRGGPTIFDRRGPGTSDYSAPERDRDRPNRSEEDYRTAAPAATEPPPPEVAEQPRTVLVFKDGRRLEISNYAIAGSTLYNLSDGLPRKVALAELDLPATVKQNDDRGVDFQIPARATSN